jgi:hypothetical protein
MGALDELELIEQIEMQQLGQKCTPRSVEPGRFWKRYSKGRSKGRTLWDWDAGSPAQSQLS